jgi:hypothetical protein
MGIRERLARLEQQHAKATAAYSYHVFVKEPGTPGRDAEGWRPREKEAAAAAKARGDRVTIINVTEHKPKKPPRGD